VKIPVYLAASFGELRANHFHSGIDIKTDGRVGVPIYAAADGFVSRISVSSGGYGLALYIDHPNGTTTLYGHLQSFRKDIQSYVKEEQYDRESFSVDLELPAERFPVKRGDFVALSGNSGGSAGPHLHFEIRDRETQTPVNPLIDWFTVADSLPPTIQAVMLYPLSPDARVSGQLTPQRTNVTFNNGKYRLTPPTPLKVYGDIGFGVLAFDRFSGSPNNKCGIYEMELAVDDIVVYHYRMDRFGFDFTRYINSHTDYAYYLQHYQMFQKLWVESGNRLQNYPLLMRRGIVNLSDGIEHTVNYTLWDTNGNASRLEFVVLAESSAEPASGPETSSVRQLAEPDCPFHLADDGIEVYFREGTFYTDVPFEYSRAKGDSTLYSPVFHLHSRTVPVHQGFHICIRAENLPASMADKALLCLINGRSKASAGGKWDNGWVVADVRQLGTYAIVVDTVPPVITPLNIKNHSILQNKNKISFKISDNFSGIAHYRGEIDGKWALFEYDAKNRLLEHTFDSARTALGKNHDFKLTVTDAKGNQAVYTAKFYR
jgi:hypothetical protein